MTTGERLRIISKIVGGASTFARHLGLKPTSLYRYFQDSINPGTPILNGIAELGFSINWLLTGRGDMFAVNFAGQTLLSFLQRDFLSQPNNDMGVRLAKFCKQQYDSQENVLMALRVSQEELSRSSDKDLQLSTELLTKLASQGCNLNWLLTGKGYMYYQEGDEPGAAPALFDEEKEYTIRVRIVNGKIKILGIDPF